MAAAQAVKQEGRPNDLLERLATDEAFQQIDLQTLADPSRFVGRAPQQVDEFLAEVIDPILAQHPDEGLEAKVEV